MTAVLLENLQEPRYDNSNAANTHHRAHRYPMGSLFVRPRSAYARQNSGAEQNSARPTIESVSDTLAFISWTTPNPGGTILHYAVVRYGKDPNHLQFTAKSPTRINPSHNEMVFRVRAHPGSGARDNVLLPCVLGAGQRHF